MRTNKALVKHEVRNMKWMMLYFILVAVGGILYLNTNLNQEYMDTFTRGLIQNRSIILESVRRIINMMIIPMGAGIALMIYLQFKDSKSVEVGNFLKSLPINNREYYTTKLMGGLINLTIPTLILIAGVLLVRNSHMYWISDAHKISLFSDFIAKGDSIINIVSIFVMTYLVAVSTYTFLFMIQYIVMNITGGLIVGILVWLSPIFILGSIMALYGEFIERIYPTLVSRYTFVERVMNYIQPWTYPINTYYSRPVYSSEYANGLLDNMHLICYEGILWKILVTLLISIVSVSVGYVLSKKSKVEDSDSFISFKWARRIFVVGVTVCSALLAGMFSQIFMGRFNTVDFIPLHIIMVVGGSIGFIVSRKITEVKSKQGGII